VKYIGICSHISFRQIVVVFKAKANYYFAVQRSISEKYTNTDRHFMMS